MRKNSFSFMSLIQNLYGGQPYNGLKSVKGLAITCCLIMCMVNAALWVVVITHYWSLDLISRFIC